MMPSAKRFVRGFTLLELMVVLVLAALVATVAGVSGQALLSRAQYHQTVKEVNALLVSAKAEAVRSGRVVSVRYAADRLAVETSADRQVSVPADVVVEAQPVPVVAPAGTLPSIQSNAQSAGQRPVFVFYPDGTAHGGGLAVLRSGRGVMFRVNWLLGVVESSEYHQGAGA